MEINWLSENLTLAATAVIWNVLIEDKSIFAMLLAKSAGGKFLILLGGKAEAMLSTADTETSSGRFMAIVAANFLSILVLLSLKDWANFTEAAASKFDSWVGVNKAGDIPLP